MSSEMENYLLDLNADWDEDEFVPSTQYSEQPSTASMSLSQTTDSFLAHEGSPCSLQAPASSLGSQAFSLQTDGSLNSFERYHFSSTPRIGSPFSLQVDPIAPHPPSSSPEPCATRTPLSTITNQTTCLPTEGKKKAKPKKGKRASAASTSTTILLPASQPTPSSITKIPASVKSAPISASTNSKSNPIAPDGGRPVSQKLFYRTGHWTLKETITLVDGRAQLVAEMSKGNLGVMLKTQDERWEYISKYCVQRGVLRSSDQCLFRWDRILAAFKKIHDYERHIPSGGDGYWTMSSNKRDEIKLPRSFSEDLYAAMLDRMGSERSINPASIVYDTTKDILGDSFTSPEKAANLNKKGETMDEEGSSGKKRKRGDKMSILQKELEGTTKQLLSFMERIDSRRTKHDEDVVELTKAEFDESVQLNRKRLALEEESNHALKQIAEAFKCIAMHVSTPDVGKHTM